MPWKKGESGNPNGRPPKNRTLTEALEKAGSKTVNFKGRNIAGQRLLGAMVWEGLTTGNITFPDEKVMKLAPQDWMALMQFVYKQIDGPPKTELDITSDGERIPTPLYVDYRLAITETEE